MRNTMMILYVFVGSMAACTGHTEGTASLDIDKAAVLFEQKCSTCHGSDGRKMMYGAKDLSLSKLNPDQKQWVISQGNKVMPKFSNELTPSEIALLTRYTEKFRAK